MSGFGDRRAAADCARCRDLTGSDRRDHPDAARPPCPSAASVAFLLGWVLGVAAVVTVVALAVDPVDDSQTDAPSTFISVFKIVLGAAALLLAAQQWRARPKPGQEPTMPAWMSAVDTMTTVKAGGLGALLAASIPRTSPSAWPGESRSGPAGCRRARPPWPSLSSSPSRRARSRCRPGLPHRRGPHAASARGDAVVAHAAQPRGHVRAAPGHRHLDPGPGRGGAVR